MNKVEEIAGKIIAKAQENKEFLDVHALVELHNKYGVTCICVVSTKGDSGKSTGFQNEICMNLLTDPDYNAVGIRNTDDEIGTADVPASFTKALRNYGFDLEKDWEVTRKGVYQKVSKSNLRQVNLKRIAFADMNTILRYASQNSLACDIAVYDEFISNSFHKRDLVKDYYTLLDTFIRTKNGLAVLLANAHESANDIIIELGIPYQGDTGQNQVYYEEDTGILALYITHYENKHLKQAKSNLRRMFKNSESVQNFMNGFVANDNAHGVISGKWIKDYFKPMYRYYCNNTEYCVGYTTGGKYPNMAYVVQVKIRNVFCEQIKMKRQDYDHLLFVCYHVRDKIFENKYIKKSGNLNTARYLIENYNNGSLAFSSDFGAKEFRNYILPLLDAFIED